ncbi:MAG: hypothetical protein AB2L14_25705 [Candidatus Xenobiia bacterium LiM19]
MESEKVQISTKILVLLVLSLLGAFVIIAYLLGRESARRESPAIVQTGVTSAQVMPSAQPAEISLPTQSDVQPPPAVLPSYSIPQAPQAYQAAETQPAYTYHTPAAPAVAAHTPRGSAAAVQQSSGQLADREQVTQYFSRFDQIGAMTKSFDDPNAYAQEMLKQVTSGDTSGIDKLIENYQSFHDQIGQLAPPATCKEHQRQTMAVVSRSISNLNDLKSAISRGDVSALTRITGDMKSVEEQSRKVDKLASQIKTQYGIK